MADSYTYTAYGSLVASSGSDTNPFRYGGEFGYYTDSTFGTILCGVRWYDPDIGRWLSRDPIGYYGGDNLYAYCVGDPVGGADPSGMWWIPPEPMLWPSMSPTMRIQRMAVYLTGHVKNYELIYDYIRYKYTDCGRFVYQVLRWSYDPYYPFINVTNQWGHVKQCGLYEYGPIVRGKTVLEPGDILFVITPRGLGVHTGIFMGWKNPHNKYSTISASLNDRPPMWRPYWSRYNYYARLINGRKLK